MPSGTVVWIEPYSHTAYDSGWRVRMYDLDGPTQDWCRISVSGALDRVTPDSRPRVIEATLAVIEQRRAYEEAVEHALDYELGVEPKARRRGQRGALARHRRDTDRLEAELADAVSS